jgi:LCP family protein required for cell wall assembly
LLLGIDQRPDEAGSGGDPGRTDSMILASIDFDAHLASLVSIPRDGFVVIPGHGNERVNAAYTFGEIDKRGNGPELAKRTVGQLFSLPVDRYALVDIHAMEQVIDTLGGVWIDNPKRLVDTAYPTDNYRTITIDIPAGRQLMDGVTAVQYARTRHPDSDYGRQGRQQQVLLAIRDQALQLSVLPRLPQLLPQVQQLVRTDLTPVEIAQVMSFGRGLDRTTDILSLPPNPQLTPGYTGPGGASYINLTTTYRSAVRQLVEQPRVAAEQADIGVYNAGAPVGTGGTAAALLGRLGLPVARVETAPQRVVATRIEAGSGARETAAMIAKTLGLPADALVMTGESSSVRVLLGPDAHIPVG